MRINHQDDGNEDDVGGCDYFSDLLNFENETSQSRFGMNDLILESLNVISCAITEANSLFLLLKETCPSFE